MQNEGIGVRRFVQTPGIWNEQVSKNKSLQKNPRNHKAHVPNLMHYHVFPDCLFNLKDNFKFFFPSKSSTVNGN